MSDEMLKLAEQVDWQMRYYGDVRFSGDAAKLVQAALRAAAASAEPVGWISESELKQFDADGLACINDVQNEHYKIPLYTHPAPDAEIVAALESELAGYDKTIEAAKADDALSETGRRRVIECCWDAKGAVRKFAAALAKAKGGSQQAQHVSLGSDEDDGQRGKHRD